MKKIITSNDLLAASYAFLGVIALFPPTTHSEVALGICLIVLAWMYWSAAREVEELIEINKDTLRQTLRLCDNIPDDVRAELTKLLGDSK